MGTVSEAGVPMILKDCEAWYQIQSGFQSGSPSALASRVNDFMFCMCFSWARMRWPSGQDEEVMSRGSGRPSIDEVVISFNLQVWMLARVAGQMVHTLLSSGEADEAVIGL